MAEENAPAAAATETQAPEAEGPESANELRDTLVAKLRENRATRESEAGAPKPKIEKPKRGEPDKPGAKDTDADAGEDPPELAALKAERRSFAKHKRKWEGQAASREQQITQYEQRAQAQIATFEKDPIAWLKAQKVDVRATLLRMANEDTEDPRDKKLRELEDEQRRSRTELENEKRERTERAQKAEQRAAEQTIEAELGKAWGTAEVDEFPTVAAALEPEHVAARAREILVEHYRKSGKELAPSEVFATMERELAPLKGKLAIGKKKPEAPGAGPGNKRQAREVASPEAPTKRERPSDDVTRRITREQSVGRPQNFDRDSLRDRLIDKARDVLRR